MVKIAERIWPAWETEREGFPDEPVLLLRFDALGDVVAAERAVLESVREAQEALAETVAYDTAFVGEWDVVRSGDSVLVKVVECDLLATMLPAIGSELQRRGIDGSFDLAERPAVATPPRIAHLLECRLQIRGQRHSRGDHHRWVTDPDARDAVLVGAARWCRRFGDQAAETLRVATAPPVAIAPDENVFERLRNPPDDTARMTMSALAADGFRILSTLPNYSPVGLIEGGTRVEGARWRRALDELTVFLRDHADWLAYAFVKRGSSVTSAHFADSLAGDWPPRVYSNGHAAYDDDASPFADSHAPDAFGVQLLGPGYAGRVPHNAAWRAQPVGTASTLLEHVDPAGWFNAPFVPYGDADRLARSTEPPPLLVEARDQLAGILYTPQLRVN